MSYFKELLDSYSNLKKRRLVILTEQPETQNDAGFQADIQKASQIVVAALKNVSQQTNQQPNQPNLQQFDQDTVQMSQGGSTTPKDWSRFMDSPGQSPGDSINEEESAQNSSCPKVTQPIPIGNARLLQTMSTGNGCRLVVDIGNRSIYVMLNNGVLSLHGKDSDRNRANFKSVINSILGKSEDQSQGQGQEVTQQELSPIDSIISKLKATWQGSVRKFYPRDPNKRQKRQAWTKYILGESNNQGTVAKSLSIALGFRYDPTNGTWNEEPIDDKTKEEVTKTYSEVVDILGSYHEKGAINLDNYRKLKNRVAILGDDCSRVLIANKPRSNPSGSSKGLVITGEAAKVLCESISSYEEKVLSKHDSESPLNRPDFKLATAEAGSHVIRSMFHEHVTLLELYAENCRGKEDSLCNDIRKYIQKSFSEKRDKLQAALQELSEDPALDEETAAYAKAIQDIFKSGGFGDAYAKVRKFHIDSKRTRGFDLALPVGGRTGSGKKADNLEVHRDRNQAVKGLIDSGIDPKKAEKLVHTVKTGEVLAYLEPGVKKIFESYLKKHGLDKNSEINIVGVGYKHYYNGVSFVTLGELTKNRSEELKNALLSGDTRSEDGRFTGSISKNLGITRRELSESVAEVDKEFSKIDDAVSKMRRSRTVDSNGKTIIKDQYNDSIKLMEDHLGTNFTQEELSNPPLSELRDAIRSAEENPGGDEESRDEIAKAIKNCILNKKLEGKDAKKYRHYLAFQVATAGASLKDDIYEAVSPKQGKKYVGSHNDCIYGTLNDLANGTAKVSFSGRTINIVDSNGGNIKYETSSKGKTKTSLGEKRMESCAQKTQIGESYDNDSINYLLIEQIKMFSSLVKKITGVSR